MCENNYETDRTDYYLSDIYIENDSSIIRSVDEDSDSLALYRVEFSLPIEINTRKTAESECAKELLDQDGDLILDRIDDRMDKFIFTLGTQMKTSLNDVGLQLWRASFYLADFLIHNSHLIRETCVLELGAGLGITSLVAALYARKVYCTDLERIVQNAQKNYERNAEIILGSNKNACIVFKTLNWEDKSCVLSQNSKNTELNLTLEDLSEIKSNVRVLLAADVVYDNYLTLHFMNALYTLMSDFDVGPDTLDKMICYISNEKRINFSLDEMEPADTAFKFFQECLSDLDKYVDAEKNVMFEVSRVNVDDLMPQYIHSYRRNKYLTIWKVESFKK